MIDPKSDYWRKNIGDVVFQMMRAPADEAAERLQNQFDAVEGAHIMQDPEMTADKAASIFNSSKLTAAKAASIINDKNLLAERAASIFDNANLSADKAASIFDNANLSVAKLADIFGNANLSNDRATSIFNLMTRAIADLASVFNDADVDAAKAAYVTENTTKDVADLASIFDNANLSADKAASIADNTNLTEAKLQSILDNTNLSIQKGQEIVDAMSSPSKIGTGGRRGVIGDDWEDDKLTSRDKAATVATALDKIFQKFRPEWDTANADTKISVESGYLKIAASADYDLYIKLTDNITEGTWKMRQKLGAVNSTRGYNFTLAFMLKDKDNHYAAYISGYDDYVRFSKQIAGTVTHLIAASISRDTDWHEVKITRDADGNFELFYDGVSKGTATDTEITSGDLAIGQFQEDNDEDAYVDDLEVY